MEEILYPVYCVHRMIFVYVAAQRDNIKVVRAEGASILFPELLFSLCLLKPQEVICIYHQKQKVNNQTWHNYKTKQNRDLKKIGLLKVCSILVVTRQI